MNFSSLAPTTFALLCLLATPVAKADPCRLFSFYSGAALPAPPSENEIESDKRTEAVLIREIERRLPRQNFAKLFATSALQDFNPEERKDWLVCALHYVRMDLNKNGLNDWTPVVDGAISEVLVANDDDLDGDGVENAFDPAPLKSNRPAKRPAAGLSRATRPKAVPPFLIAQRAPREQAELYREFGILALDHSDQHSGPVLRELLLVLREGLATGMQPPSSIRFVYSFRSHDGVDDIAAYHRQTRALSIGGLAAYDDKELSPLARVRVLSAFAHEIGHAALFERLSPRELLEIGARFGHWSNASIDLAKRGDFFLPSFLHPHPLQDLMRLGSRGAEASRGFIGLSLWGVINLTSEYAATNLHEWFADAFAASVLQRLGEKGRLGPDWRPLLTRLPEHKGGYWVNYNNLSPDFRAWIDRRFALVPPSASKK